MLYVRIPSWADGATVDGLPAVAGTLFGVACDKGKRTTVKVELHPEVKVEYGWGAHGVNISTVEYAAAGASVLCTRAAMSSAICSVAAGRLAASDSSDISRRRSSSSSHPHTVEAMVLGSPE